MSGERITLPACSRSRSYGSLVRSPLTPAHQGRVEHTLRPGETLPGLALKYGVTMEEIKRANRLYTNESIFLKKSLSIPVMGELDACMVSPHEEGAAPAHEQQHEDGRDITELTPDDFLKRLDGLISQSKHAAVRGRQDAEKRISAFEEACSSRTSFRRSQSVILKHNTTVSVPHTVTRLTRKLREREDEIFQL